MAASRKAPAKKATVDELLAAIDNINELELVEEIDVDEDMNIKELIEVLREASSDLYLTDPFDDDSLATFKKIGLKLQEPKKITAKKDKADTKKDKADTKKDKADTKKDKADTKKDKNDSESPFKKKGYSRSGCIGEVIKGMKKGSGMPLEELIEAINASYGKYGGKDNVKETKGLFNMTNKALIALKIIEIEDGTVTKL